MFSQSCHIVFKFSRSWFLLHLIFSGVFIDQASICSVFPPAVYFLCRICLGLSGSQVLKTGCAYFRTGSWEWKNWSCLLTTVLLGTVLGRLGSGFAIFWRWRGTELTTALFLVKKYLSKPSSRYRTTSCCAMNDVWQVVTCRIRCSPSPAVLKPMKFTVACF